MFIESRQRAPGDTKFLGSAITEQYPKSCAVAYAHCCPQHELSEQGFLCSADFSPERMDDTVLATIDVPA